MDIEKIVLEFAGVMKDNLLNRLPKDTDALEYFQKLKTDGKYWDVGLYNYLKNTREKKKEKNLAIEYFFSFAMRYPKTIEFLIMNKKWTKENLFVILEYFNEYNNTLK